MTITELKEHLTAYGVGGSLLRQKKSKLVALLEDTIHKYSCTLINE